MATELMTDARAAEIRAEKKRLAITHPGIRFPKAMDELLDNRERLTAEVERLRLQIPTDEDWKEQAELDAMP